MSFVSRGFHGRRRGDVDPTRVPPGQYVTNDFPVLSAGPAPHTALDYWSFEIDGAVESPRSWSWSEFRALPRLLLAHLDFWKSAKWVRRLTLTLEDEPGFWESHGYHNYGDPWKEQRYAGD